MLVEIARAKAMSIKYNYDVMHESDESSNYVSFCETSLSYVSFIPLEFKQFICREYEPAPLLHIGVATIATGCIMFNMINYFVD